MYSSRGCVENCCVSTPARRGPTWSHEPWTAGQGLFCFFSSYLFYNLHVSGIGKTEMKHNKFKTNKLTTAAWTKQSRHDKTSNRVSCGRVLMASTMLHEKCCNTVLQIGALTQEGGSCRSRPTSWKIIFLLFFLQGKQVDPKSYSLRHKLRKNQSKSDQTLAVYAPRCI